MYPCVHLRGGRRLTASLTVLLVASFALAAAMPAWADPPPWAPAHGARAKGKGRGGHVAYAIPPGIAKGTCQRKHMSSELAGGALGAAVGGLLGSQVGSGSGQLAATAAGTLLGALVGSSIGRDMDTLDHYCVAKTLEYAPQGRMIEWQNPDNNAHYTVTPTKTYERQGRYCREYQTKVIVGNKVQETYGTACRQPDGSWKIVN